MADVAKRSDSPTSPLPTRRATLAIDLAFTAEEFSKLAAGFVPEVMEHKWFIYFERPWLFLHRSWTGFCIFQVRIEAEGDVYRVREALVNRDPTQYDETDNDLDTLRLTMQLCHRVGRDIKDLWQRYLENMRHCANINRSDADSTGRAGSP